MYEQQVVVVLKFASKLHENFLLRNDIRESLYDLLDFIVESWLGPDVVETLNQLFHDFSTIFFILGAQHAHQVHDAFYETTVVEVKVFDQTFEDVLVGVEEGITVLLKELRIPLNNSLLCLTGSDGFELLF